MNAKSPFLFVSDKKQSVPTFQNAIILSETQATAITTTTLIYVGGWLKKVL